MILTTQKVTKAFFLVSLLLICSLLFGCDCDDGDMTGAFGPRCGDDELALTDGAAGNGTGTGTLLASDSVNASLRRFEGISSLEGASATDQPLTGALTRLSNPTYLTVHPSSGQLIVADQGAAAVLFFSSPTDLEGNVPPERILTGAGTELLGPVQVFVDSSNDELYVLDKANSQVLVFADASTIEGEVAPIRRIGGATTAITSPNAFFFRGNTEQLSVLNPSEILTFENFRSANGSPAPSGRVSGAATTFSNLTYGELTNSGNLILVDAGTDQILTFDGWIFDRTNEAPTRIVGGNNTRISEPRQFVLSGDSMYLADGANVLFFDGIGTLEGNDFPTRFFSGTTPNTQSLTGLTFP